MSAKVLDAYAVMAFFENEPGADAVRELLSQGAADKTRLLMSVVNLGEVWYSIAREYSRQKADACVREMEAMPIELIDADWEQSYQAAKFKVSGPLSYGDCFAAALAKTKTAELVTGDKEFKSLGNEIKIHWL